MLAAFIAAVVIAAILGLSELAWRRFHIQDELARKFVHITTGTFIAFLPFWVDYQWIMVLALGFIAVNVLNHFTSVFHAINDVKRKSWGDVLFGVGILVVAWLEPSAWLFAAAVLQVAIADGFAALAGVKYGLKHNTYYVLGQPKTVIGSGLFFILSGLVLTLLLYADPYYADPATLIPAAIMTALLLTCLENLAVYGTDNLILPVATILCFGLL